jgi:hypothetical protein
MPILVDVNASESTKDKHNVLAIVGHSQRLSRS